MLAPARPKHLIQTGDCRELLKALPEKSVNCCVTSPPYFGLRDYGHAGQIGLEKTLNQYVAELVAVFREVRRVLRSDGTFWLNLGDSYAGGGYSNHANTNGAQRSQGGKQKHSYGTGLASKQRLMIPARVALALQADGWFLRDEIIWHKPNPMPESVTDRCTKAHEYIFMLSKSERYFYDHEAVKEPAVGTWNGSRFDTGKIGEHQLGRAQKRPKGNRKTFRGGGVYTQGQSFNNSSDAQNDSIGNQPNESGMRNRRSVWSVATKPFKEAHFATFPPALIEPCVLAGCPVNGIVLDPFGGAGTTGLVATQNGRRALLIELNPDYAAMADKRIRDAQ